ncbi:MAG: sulfatase-like hydrolase/transferase [Caldilineaceae bacterium]|nr:sulfatase-like hydrolase/transferase [Caldilineaceae bacterium]
MPTPNILLIHADQHRADCIGAHGHPFLQTPHLDQLIAEGANFTNAFTPIPLCTPARTSLLTGQWAMQHGVIANPDTEAARALDPQTPTFSQLLHDAGYFLGCVGKWGVDPHNLPTQYGFHFYRSERDYSKQRQQLGLPPKPTTNRWFGEVDPYITPEQSQLAWGADMTIQLLQHATEQQRPFFLRWDPSEPHLPNVVPEPYASLYPPATIPPWPNFVDPLVGKPFIQRQQRHSWGIAEWGWQEWAPIVGRYLGEITLLDHQIGRVLQRLAELGLAENTVVIYTADHGDLCGAHGMIDKHNVMYDELVRVPLIVRWPEQIRAGQRCDAFVTSAIDLAATFCELAGVIQPTTFAGQSLLPSVTMNHTATELPTPNARTDIFATYHGNQFGLYSQRMVRNAQWKYVWNATAEDEFYDLRQDPGELLNLAADPSYQEAIAALRRRLVEWMEKTGDRLLNPWVRQQLLQGRKAS